jgi:hypothetical protein
MLAPSGADWLGSCWVARKLACKYVSCDMSITHVCTCYLSIAVVGFRQAIREAEAATTSASKGSDAALDASEHGAPGGESVTRE